MSCLAETLQCISEQRVRELCMQEVYLSVEGREDDHVFYYCF